MNDKTPNYERKVLQRARSLIAAISLIVVAGACTADAEVQVDEPGASTVVTQPGTTSGAGNDSDVDATESSTESTNQSDEAEDRGDNDPAQSTTSEGTGTDPGESDSPATTVADPGVSSET